MVVLEDADDDGTGVIDEGRAMLEIVHDMAPAAKLCFATAWNSEIDFADNIRKLADKKGKCGADVIVDDVAYGDEPMFSDGMVGDAIDDVTAKGVHYFTAAGNDGEDAVLELQGQADPGEDRASRAPTSTSARSTRRSTTAGSRT